MPTTRGASSFTSFSAPERIEKDWNFGLSSACQCANYIYAAAGFVPWPLGLPPYWANDGFGCDGTIWFGTRGKWAFCARGAESAWQAVLSRVAAGQSWKKMRPGSVNVAAALLATTLRLYEKQLKRDLAKADAALTSSIADDTTASLSLSFCLSENGNF